MTTMTTLTMGSDALEGLFFAITPDPVFLSGSGRAHVSADTATRGTANLGQADDQADDIPFLPLHDRWSF